MSSKNILREIPRIIYNQLSDHPVSQSGWYMKLTITQRDQPQPHAVQLHKVPNIQHTLTPATMFYRITSFLKKPSQCNYLVTVCGLLITIAQGILRMYWVERPLANSEMVHSGTCPKQHGWFQCGILSMLPKGSWRRMGFDLIFIPLLLLKTSLLSLNSTLFSCSSIKEGQFLKNQMNI